MALERIYMDHSATTPVESSVLEAMLPYFSEFYGNASNIHSYGREARAAIDDAREKVAQLINANYNEIVFTSGGSESDNHAIKGVAYANQKKGNHIITSSVEHHAILYTCQYLEKGGFEVTYLPVDGYGMVDPDDVRKAIKGETILVSIMHANNEVGTVEPITEIGKIAKENKIIFHSDAVQSVGKIPVDVHSLNIDLLSLSAHKMYGPKGIGALYIRRGVRLDPLIHGGHHERNRRAGTENVPGIVGLGKAAQLCMNTMEEESQRLWFLTEKLKTGILDRVRSARQNGHPTERIPGILNISFDSIEGDGIILSLDLEGVCVSSGSACASGSLEPSHVLQAMGLRRELSHGAVRFSLGRHSTEEEVNRVVELLPGIVERLRSISP